MALTMMVSLGGKATSTPSMLITRVINCSQLNIAYKRKKSLKIYPTIKRKIKYNDPSFTKEKGYSKTLFLCKIKRTILCVTNISHMASNFTFLFNTYKVQVNIRYCKKGIIKSSIITFTHIRWYGIVVPELTHLYRVVQQEVVSPVLILHSDLKVKKN